MKTVGELREYCEWIEREHGSDCNVVVSMDIDVSSNVSIIHSQYASSFSIEKRDGTLHIFA